MISIHVLEGASYHVPTTLQADRRTVANDMAAESLHSCRTAKKVILDKATIKKDSIASTLLTNQTLNLFGIGSALIGLQVCYGALTTSRLNITQNLSLARQNGCNKLTG